MRDIPIEERSSEEVTHISGRTQDGRIEKILISSPGSLALNPAFDVTPARLISGFITERGIAPATRSGLATLFPDLSQ